MNPRAQRRLGVALTLLGALLGGVGSAGRAGLVVDVRWGGGSYLIDAAALLACVAGVAVEARALGMLADFFPGLRREAVAQLAAGVVLGLTACLLIPNLVSGGLDGWPSAGLAALVYLGVGRALSGAAGVAVTVAPGYLERRIDDRAAEPW